MELLTTRREDIRWHDRANGIWHSQYRSDAVTARQQHHWV